MQEKNPLVSIIIPVYNGENYLKEAIDSALAQTYKNIEIIVVNDGSTDNTDTIAKSYKDKIRYYKKENGGVSTALNLAIKKMKGEYFSWLSHDDKYYNYKIESQIDYLNKNKLLNKNVILYGNFSIMDENGEINPNSIIHNSGMLKEKSEYAFLRGCLNGITLLIPKTAFDKAGFFDESLWCTQDYDMWIRMFKDNTFIHVNEIVSITRIHSMQTTNVSEKTIVEGNNLWIKMLEGISDKRKIELEGSIYNYYLGMYNHLADTFYDEARDYCKNKCLTLNSNHFNNKMNEVAKPKPDPLISVLMPVYNAEKYLVQAIESILKQTYKNIELIIINDCSTDNSLAIAETYLHKDKRVKLINNSKNMGVSKSLNKALKASNGKYFTRQDADDFSDLTRLNKQLTYLEENNQIGFCATNINFVNEKGKLTQESVYESVNYPLEFMSCFSNVIPNATIMYRLSVIKENNIEFKAVKSAEDYGFLLDVLRFTSGVMIPGSLYNYRILSDSLFHTNMKLSIDLSLEYAKDFIKKVTKLALPSYYKYLTNFCNEKYDKLITNDEINNVFLDIIEGLSTYYNWNFYTITRAKMYKDIYMRQIIKNKFCTNILEVNNIDIPGRRFNGYDFIEKFENNSMFDINQYVVQKLSNNKHVNTFFSNYQEQQIFGKMMEFEDDLSLHSYLSITSPLLLSSGGFNNADVVHLHMFHNTRLSIFSLKEMCSRKPIVMTLHDPWMITGRCVHFYDCPKYLNGCYNCEHLSNMFPMNKDNCNYLWKIKQLTMNNLDIDFIVTSKWMYDLVKNSPITKNIKNVHLIPFGIDTDKFSNKIDKIEARKKLGIPPKDKVLFFRAQQEFKGTNYIIDAMKKYDSKDNITLLSCSEKGLLKDLNNKYNIIDLGQIDDDLMLYAYAACDIFMMPSIGESFGFMAIEAMAFEKPVIVFDNTALPSVTYAPNCGYLVKNKDSDELLKAIDYLLNNPNECKKRGKLGREIVLKNYNYERYENDMMLLYKSLSMKKKNNKEVIYNYDENNEEVRKIMYYLNQFSKSIFSSKQYKKIRFKNPISNNGNIDYSNEEVLKCIDVYNKNILLLVNRERIKLSLKTIVKLMLKNNKTMYKITSKVYQKIKRR